MQFQLKQLSHSIHYIAYRQLNHVVTSFTDRWGCYWNLYKNSLQKNKNSILCDVCMQISCPLNDYFFYDSEIATVKPDRFDLVSVDAISGPHSGFLSKLRGTFEVHVRRNHVSPPLAPFY